MKSVIYMLPGVLFFIAGSAANYWWMLHEIRQFIIRHPASILGPSETYRTSGEKVVYRVTYDTGYQRLIVSPIEWNKLTTHGTRRALSLTLGLPRYAFSYEKRFVGSGVVVQKSLSHSNLG